MEERQNETGEEEKKWSLRNQQRGFYDTKLSIPCGKQHSQNGYNLLYPLVIVMMLITLSGQFIPSPAKKYTAFPLNAHENKTHIKTLNDRVNGISVQSLDGGKSSTDRWLLFSPLEHFQ